MGSADCGIRTGPTSHRGKFIGSSFHGLKTAAPLPAISMTFRVARYRLCSSAVAASIVSMTEGQLPVVRFTSPLIAPQRITVVSARDKTRPENRACKAWIDFLRCGRRLSPGANFSMPLSYSAMVRTLRKSSCSGCVLSHFSTLGSGRFPLTSAITFVSSSQPFTDRCPFLYRSASQYPHRPDRALAGTERAACAPWLLAKAVCIARAQG